MLNTSNTALKLEPQAEPPILLRRIGSTTYKVTVGFSRTNRETVSDKMLRLVKSEVEKQ